MIIYDQQEWRVDHFRIEIVQLCCHKTDPLCSDRGRNGFSPNKKGSCSITEFSQPNISKSHFYTRRRTVTSACYAIMIGSEMCGQTPTPHHTAFAKYGLRLWSKSWTRKISGPDPPPPCEIGLRLWIWTISGPEWTLPLFPFLRFGLWLGTEVGVSTLPSVREQCENPVFVNRTMWCD